MSNFFQEKEWETDKRVKHILELKFILYFILEGISKKMFNCLFFDMADTAPIKTDSQMNNIDPAWLGLILL